MESQTGTSRQQQQHSPTSPAFRLAQFELGVSLALFLWPALSLAVADNWGGSASADKREWFAGAVMELLAEQQQQQQLGVEGSGFDADGGDAAYIEEFLLNVMQDEFEAAVDDGSAADVAETIVRLRRDCLERGNFVVVQRMRELWARKGDKNSALIRKVERNEEDDETDGSVSDSDEEAEDVEMGDAPPLVKVKAAPEIDDDGFTKVTKGSRVAR